MQDMVQISSQELHSLRQVASSMNRLIKQGHLKTVASAGEDEYVLMPGENMVGINLFLSKHDDAQIKNHYSIDNDQLNEVIEHLQTLDFANEAGDQKDEDETEDASAVIGMMDQAQYDYLLREAASNGHVPCPSCGADEFTIKKDPGCVQLKYTHDAVYYPVKSIDKLLHHCAHCDHREDSSWSASQQRIGLMEILADRLKLGLPIDRRDVYETLGDLYRELIQAGSLLLETLQTEADCIQTPGMPEFDEEGNFNGYYVLDCDDPWLVNTFEQLEALNMIKPMGGVLFKPVKSSISRKDPMMDVLLNPSDLEAPKFLN